MAPVALGAFYGEFTCNGGPLIDGVPFLPTADGHFHGQSAAGGAEIVFLGEVECTRQGNEVDKVDDDAVCLDPAPHQDEGNFSFFDDKPLSTSESRIKHTLTCKGTVQPLSVEQKDVANPQFAPDARQVILEAFVELDCIIA